ncbi:CBN-NHR-86 protein [Caenorhabditis brenneri]|uniref:CBN-NHR-86 protein n=1 Tax=Caenorhabditis brenneri TaxID=135651 RepID=G0MTE3_CAEBE|nr:CBN-NHR-86 protein [Caenorhabditis brenneri]
MELKKDKSKCSVCKEEGDGYHFGAEACRACAAFFRRSVSLDKKYVCRQNNDCDIAANVRCMCRSCRYSKCLEVGMNPAGVQQRRDVIGKRDTKPEPANINIFKALSSIGEGTSTSTDETTSAEKLQLQPAYADQMPLLSKMRINYRKMDSARLVIHRKDGQSLFKSRTPKALNYKEAAEQSIREVSLVADWVAWCFDDFVMLPIDQKKVLFRNFYTPFSMLEGAYLCHINKLTTAIILPSGDYIDMEELDKFFYVPDAEQPLTPEEVIKLFKPSFDLHRRALIIPMSAEKTDVIELFALCTLLLWDFGLDEQSDECMMIGKRVKEQIMRELAFYLKVVKKIEEPAIRVASLLTLLPALQRSVRRFQEDIEITSVFNIYAPGKAFYDLVNGKFC